MSGRLHTGGRGSEKRPRQGTAREAALDVLVRVEQDRSYSNLQLHRSIEEHGLNRQDAGLATEIVYGTIQRLNTIDFYLAQFVAKGMGKLQPWVRALLRLSFYQIYYLDRIPDHAAVNEAVNLAKRRGHQGISGMVNGVLRNVIRNKASLKLPEQLNAVQRIALEHSYPEWLVKRWIQQLGKQKTEEICAAGNEPPRVSLRANVRKLSPSELAERLHAAGYDAQLSELAPAGVIVKGGGNMALASEFAAGLYSIQDESSMLAAEWVDPQPGERVLDCCAAPGGKSAHLAELMDDAGEVVSCDVHEHKEKLIQDQAARLELRSIQTVVADARRLNERFQEQSFDRILLDAPCSGLGVLRRKPDMKWTRTEQELEELAGLQRELLETVHPLLKPGGILVYSTCTIERAENEAQVKSFLERHPEFVPAEIPSNLENRLSSAFGKPEAGMAQLLPSDYGSDGFFFARLMKRA